MLGLRLPDLALSHSPLRTSESPRISRRNPENIGRLDFFWLGNLASLVFERVMALLSRWDSIKIAAAWAGRLSGGT